MKLARVLLWAACALVVLALIAGGGYGLFFYRHPPPPAPALPSPNGYDDLARAGGMCVRSQNRIAEMSLDELRVYVAKNRNALEMVRLALERECAVPLQFTEEFAAKRVQTGSGITYLWGVLEAEGLLAEREGRLSEAITSYLDWFRLGVKGLKKGLLVERIVGDCCRAGALNRLKALEGSLGAGECRQAIQGLYRAAADDEPIEEVIEREDAWLRTWSSFAARMCVKVAFGTKSWQVRFRSTIARQRLLATELAIRAHWLEKGTRPKALADLVPEYLTSIPEDPFSAQPLLYRPGEKGYRLYSVGPDGRDDGGLLVPKKDLEIKGDFFLETDQLPESPEF